jgi:YggT family protein
MNQALTALAALTSILRTVFLAGGVALAVVATADWAARTRRLNPFGGVSRFMRARVDPRLVGVERQVLRAGGRTATTPWWALLLYGVLAMLVIAALNMISGLVQDAAFAAAGGGMGVLRLVVRVLSSWLPRLAASRWIRWSYGATEWMLRPLRNLIPSIGGVIDITPIVAYFALQFVQWLIEGILLRGVG